MLAIRAILHGMFFASLVSLHHEDVNIDRDCNFISCFDCVTSKCVWLLYFDGDENCAQSGQGIPGVEDEIIVPNRCKKPKCVNPAVDTGDAIGLAQLFGGIFGGIFLGVCGGVSCLKCGRGRLHEFERLEGGRRTWRQLAMAFLDGFLQRFARENDAEGPLLADEERQQDGGINRVHRQIEENERQEQRGQANLGGRIQQAVANLEVGQANEENEVVNNQAAVVAQLPLAHLGNQEVPHLDVGAVVEDLDIDNPQVGGLPHSYNQQQDDGGEDGQVEDGQVADGQVEDDQVEDDQVENDQVEDGQVEDDQVENDQVEDGQVENDQVEDDQVADGQVEDDQVEDDQVEDDQVVPPAQNVSPLVQQVQFIRQSTRQASQEATARMANLKLDRLI